MRLVTKEEYMAMSPRDRAAYFEAVKADREAGGSGLVIPKTESEGAKMEIDSLKTLPSSTRVSPVAQRLGNIAYDLSPAADIPFAGSAVQAGLNTAIQGGSGEQVAKSAGQAALSEGVAGMIRETLPGIPGVANLGVGLVNEAFRENPNYKAASARSGAVTAGQLIGHAMLPGIGGYIGGSLAGYYANSSLRDGWMGDATDNRSHETMRDRLEEGGYGRSDTKAAAREYSGMMVNDSSVEPGTPSSRTDLAKRDFYDQMNLEKKEEKKSATLSDYLNAKMRDNLFGTNESGSDQNSGGGTDFGDRTSSPGGMGGV